MIMISWLLHDEIGAKVELEEYNLSQFLMNSNHHCKSPKLKTGYRLGNRVSQMCEAILQISQYFVDISIFLLKILSCLIIYFYFHILFLNVNLHKCEYPAKSKLIQRYSLKFLAHIIHVVYSVQCTLYSVLCQIKTRFISYIH